jgi:hypothetical protein
MSLSDHLISRLRKIDWDFPGSPSESPFSAIHWHPARFASQVPSSLIGLLSKPGDVVLDPFMGSGTTLVEAQRLGRKSIGLDLNPVACLIARAKTLSVSMGKIEQAIEFVDKEAQDCLSKSVFGRIPRSKVPASVQSKWYTTRALDNLGVLWNLIEPYRGIAATFSKAAFSAILLPVCRETRHWGYVCDNSTPHGSYDRDVLSEYRGVLNRFRLAYVERDIDRIATQGERAKIAPAKIWCGDAREILSKVPPESVDLIITSPPYFGVSDYVKSQRLSMEWFGIGLERCLRKGGLCVVIVGESSKRDSLLARVLGQLLLCGLKSEVDLNRRVSSLRRQLPSITSEHLMVLSK